MTDDPTTREFIRVPVPNDPLLAAEFGEIAGRLVDELPDSIAACAARRAFIAERLVRVRRRLAELRSAAPR